MKKRKKLAAEMNFRVLNSLVDMWQDNPEMLESDMKAIGKKERLKFFQFLLKQCKPGKKK